MGYPLFALGTNLLDSRGRADFLADGIIVEIDGVVIASARLTSQVIAGVRHDPSTDRKGST